ncbi:aminoglycoside 6-adenylyltransferase [Gracilibacillus sp. S3-1-1]|uniref:Aminoglycoside 6-adenylyltransferase n=1 Tax=Gracilibacillus pellucidus TaxID=3095368 RepID=A0ACC6M8B8_9BACI|nr:aminoglycoside 6-adenylyltransferase [Gracilibacillus sp. S3-1-1]MDX8047214.1 aminoglycoside 6-adenylyltransferase [Gracilibacillus sp. S3-1-1]
MRDEQVMMELILHFAKEDPRIRAVYMNGSRTNPHVPKDIFQDYDIVYVVTEVSPFIKDKSWISYFGDLIMMQEPDRNDFANNSEIAMSYGFLMLFTDGNRIDLRLQTNERMLEEYGKDKLTLPLMDKENILPAIASPTDMDYHVQMPTKAEYDSYTNNFWWCLQNVAKGIWRDELPYAKLMFEHTTRVSLDKMVEWWIGIKYDYQISTGKMGKYFQKYLPPSYWEMYKSTYSDSDYTNMWESIFVTCELFRILAKEVAAHFHFSYPIEDDQNMTTYLQDVRRLPSNATSIR